MQQLAFELAAAEPPAFANFVAGPNAEALAALARMARGELAETGVLLWGARGAGKSHLLRATVAAAGAAGRDACYCSSPAALTADGAQAAPGMLVAIDAIDTAEPVAQGLLFTLYNRLAAEGGQLLAAAGMPPARLPLRDDLRTRLGHGLIYEVLPLADADKAAALSAYARARGFRLSDEVLAYLLAHGTRDMPALVATLAALDRHSLSTRRPITVPLLRDWLRHSTPDGRPE